jgi:hypothetical protein
MLSYQTDLRVKPDELLRTAQELSRANRSRGWAALNDLFRAGSPPDPQPEGRLAGKLLALDIAPGLTQFYSWLMKAWMPWRGKTFDPSQQRGDNIFTKDSYLLARLFNSFYRGFHVDTPETYRAFAFRTYTAPGLIDTDRTVLKIDYDLPENPSLNIRRVLDELVQLDEGLYLGKAHVRWWIPVNKWHTVAFFSLQKGFHSE